MLSDEDEGKQSLLYLSDKFMCVKYQSTELQLQYEQAGPEYDNNNEL